MGLSGSGYYSFCLILALFGPIRFQLGLSGPYYALLSVTEPYEALPGNLYGPEKGLSGFT